MGTVLNNGGNGQCLHCGRGNRGHELERCSDDCPYEMIRDAAPDLLTAAQALLDEIDSPADFNAWQQAKRDLRAAVCKAREDRA